MEDTRYIVFRCYSCEPIYTFSKTIINMINLLDGINNNKGDYYLRHNLSQNATQKKVSSKSLDTFLKKLEDQKVKDFEFICRLKDTDSNTVFPFRFQIHMRTIGIILQKHMEEVHLAERYLYLAGNLG